MTNRAQKHVSSTDDSNVHQAALCLIVSADDKVLAVSRKHDPNDFGLPGCKVDQDETPKQAAARELWEETGLIAIKLVPVFTLHAGDFITTTFACKVKGDITTAEKGVVRWVDQATLTQGTFGEYNRRLFEKLKKLT